MRTPTARWLSTPAASAGRGHAYDVGQGCVRDMMAAGIVDPTLVVKAALEQAASGAAMLISAEALVLPRAPQESYRP